MLKALRYAKRLIGFESTSNLSNRLISKYIERKLTKYGFVTERLEFRDANNVRKVNIVGKKGLGLGGFAYFSHTDVVPATHWFTDRFGPYDGVVVKERLYGRGACDMKGSIACMLDAVQQVSADDMKNPVYVVCTADEEIGYGGAKQVVEESKFYREMVEGGSHAVIGEPTLLDVVNAHKGTYGFTAVAKGKAAHSSTREGVNANLAMIPFLVEMKAIYDETETSATWQNGEFVPPTVSWNIGINDHNDAINITSEQSVCTVYFRPMPGQEPKKLIKRAEDAAAKHGLYFEVIREIDGFNTPVDSKYVKTALQLSHKGIARTAAFGTDGGVLTELENKVVFGPGNIAQAHTNDEWIAIEQLSLGTEMFGKFIRHYCV